MTLDLEHSAPKPASQHDWFWPSECLPGNARLYHPIANGHICAIDNQFNMLIAKSSDIYQLLY